MKPLKILGIESSCDETAAAIVTSERQILANIVWSQLKEHRPYGGVVPEIAARAHVEAVDKTIAEALHCADISLDEIDVIAVTGGPGLIGGVMVGVMTAKALALATGKPLVAVNHLEGHALTVRLTDAVAFPFLLLLISGGHCQWLAVQGIGQYQLLGATRDDALGEAFDKTAKMLGLPYPGGPMIEQLALEGNPKRFPFPRPMTDTESCDFSFSGLKTAVLHAITPLRNAQMQVSEQDKRDICASFQAAAGDCLTNRLHHAMQKYESAFNEAPTQPGKARREAAGGAQHWGGKPPLNYKQLVIAGGVAANLYLRERIEEACNAKGYQLFCPPLRLCTDNAAMIAWAGYEQYLAGTRTGYEFEPRARWPLWQ